MIGSLSLSLFLNRNTKKTDFSQLDNYRREQHCDLSDDIQGRESTCATEIPNLITLDLSDNIPGERVTVNHRVSPFDNYRLEQHSDLSDDIYQGKE